jgi:hypothetical protein
MGLSTAPNNTGHQIATPDCGSPNGTVHCAQHYWSSNVQHMSVAARMGLSTAPNITGHQMCNTSVWQSGWDCPLRPTILVMKCATPDWQSGWDCPLLFCVQRACLSCTHVRLIATNPSWLLPECRNILEKPAGSSFGTCAVKMEAASALESSVRMCQIRRRHAPKSAI